MQGQDAWVPRPMREVPRGRDQEIHRAEEAKGLAADAVRSRQVRLAQGKSKGVDEMMTLLKIWAVVNLVGIAIATAAGIYRDVTGGEDEDRHS